MTDTASERFVLISSVLKRLALQPDTAIVLSEGDFGPNITNKTLAALQVRGLVALVPYITADGAESAQYERTQKGEILTRVLDFQAPIPDESELSLLAPAPVANPRGAFWFDEDLIIHMHTEDDPSPEGTVLQGLTDVKGDVARALRQRVNEQISRVRALRLSDFRQDAGNDPVEETLTEATPEV